MAGLKAAAPELKLFTFTPEEGYAIIAALLNFERNFIFPKQSRAMALLGRYAFSILIPGLPHFNPLKAGQIELRQIDCAFLLEALSLQENNPGRPPSLNLTNNSLATLKTRLQALFSLDPPAATIINPQQNPHINSPHLAATLEEIRQLSPQEIINFTGDRSNQDIADFSIDWQEWVDRHPSGTTETWRAAYHRYVTHYSLGSGRQLQDFTPGRYVIYYGDPQNPMVGMLAPSGSNPPQLSFSSPNYPKRYASISNVQPWALAHPLNYTLRREPPSLGQKVWFQLSFAQTDNLPILGEIQSIQAGSHWKTSKYLIKSETGTHDLPVVCLFDHCQVLFTEPDGSTLWY